MSQDKHTTDVIFRRYKDGGLIALFPALPGTRDPFTCDSYQTVGQHGAASADLDGTKPARGADVLALQRELEGLGYRLRIMKRFTKAHHSARRAELGRKV